MDLQGPNISFPGVELNRIKDSESRAFRQESLDRLGKIDGTLQSVNEKLERERSERLESEKNIQQEQKKLSTRETIRFWITVAITAIGSIAAIISAVATIVLN